MLPFKAQSVELRANVAQGAGTCWEQILGVDERLKCCPQFECVVLSCFSSPSTCKAEKGKGVLLCKASRPSHLPSSCPGLMLRLKEKGIGSKGVGLIACSENGSCLG